MRQGPQAAVGDQFLRDPDMVVYSVLLGMGVRLGFPLAMVMIIYLHGGMLAEAGLVYYLMVCYPVMLVVETILSLPDVNAATD